MAFDPIFPVPRQRPRTILLIEDEEAISELLRDELSDLGYRVEIAVNGVDGLEQIQSIEPDIVICDRAMPAMTGSELLRRLRGYYPQYQTLPFIFLTAMTDPEDRDEVLPDKPFAYMTKPVNFDLLEKTIERALQT